MMHSALIDQFAKVADRCEASFLGLRSWYHYLETNPYPDCSIKDFHLLPNDGQKSDVPLVLLAVVDDLIRIAALVAVVFVIYGGIKYVTSQGNPDQSAQAQSTVVNALLGLTIAIVAIAVVSFIGNSFN